MSGRCCRGSARLLRGSRMSKRCSLSFPRTPACWWHVRLVAFSAVAHLLTISRAERQSSGMQP